MGAFLSTAGDIIIRVRSTLVTSLLTVTINAAGKYAGIGVAQNDVVDDLSDVQVAQPFGKDVNISRMYGRFRDVSTKTITLTLFKNGIATTMTTTVNAGLTAFELELPGGITYNPTDTWALCMNTDGGNDTNRNVFVYFDMIEVNP